MKIGNDKRNSVKKKTWLYLDGGFLFFVVYIFRKIDHGEDTAQVSFTPLDICQVLSAQWLRGE